MAALITALETTVTDLQFRPPGYPVDEPLLCALLIEWTHALRSSSLPGPVVDQMLRRIAMSVAPATVLAS